MTLFESDRVEKFTKNSPWILLVIIVIVFSILNPFFFSYSNLGNILGRVPYILCMALGLSIVMAAGDFDLSFAALSELTIALIASIAGIGGFWLAFFVSLATILTLGLVNAIGVVKLGIHPWLVTLGTMLIGLGAATVITGGYQISLSYSQLKVIAGNLVGIPIPAILSIVLAISIYFIVHRTKFGEYVYVSGGNREAGLREGVNITTTRIKAYLIASFLYWAAGISYFTQTTVYRSGQIQLTLIDVILVAFIGKAISSRRVVNIPGAIFGVLFLAILANGLGLIGVQAYWIGLVKGLLTLIIIVGVSIREGEVVQLE